MNYSQFLRNPNRRTELLYRVIFNLENLERVMERLSDEPVEKRMYRMPQDILPLFTHPDVYPIYAKWMPKIVQRLIIVKRKADAAGIRLSTHPGQFIVPNSRSAEVRQNSCEDLNLWADLFWQAGWRGRGVDDFCMTIHTGPKHPDTQALNESWRAAKKLLSKPARKLIAVENDDKTWSALQTLELCEEQGFRFILDLHHAWCVRGKWLKPRKDMVERIKATWAGRRPKLHFSYPRDKKKHRDRTHSDYLKSFKRANLFFTWSRAGFDAICEFKAKNIAVDAIHGYFIKLASEDSNA